MPSTKIAFTSCARYQPHVPQVAWDDIAATDPDVLLLLGDQIYMDFGLWPFTREYQGKPKQYSAAEFAAVMRRKYELQWHEPHFAALLRQMRAKNGLLGVWDDHDFAWNNAYGADTTLDADVGMAQKRELARALFHEFMACAPQPPELYGCVDTPQARIILLDNRYHATALTVERPELMGQAQMDFLASHLQHDRPYTLIAGGLTLTYSRENWSRYRAEFARFASLLSNLKRVIYLGGDIHKNAFKAPRPDGQPPCYEIISSGLCVNILGLPFEFDRRRNWTLLELDDDVVRVHQHDKKGVSRYRIDAASWQFEALGRVERR
jgi:phosphodiesterase/alkaline phosphatase D-like protein